MKRSVFNFIILSALGVGVAACSNDISFNRFTPEPPPMVREDITTVQLYNPHTQTHTIATDPSYIPSIEPAAGSPDAWVVPPEDTRPLGLEQSRVPADCKLLHRFDRKSLIAYEWDDSRVGFDVSGVGFSGSKVEGAMISYTMRLSPDKKAYKSKREKCRYESGWQGLIGSGYNEFFVRDKDTVMQGLRGLRHDIEDGFNKSF